MVTFRARLVSIFLRKTNWAFLEDIGPRNTSQKVKVGFDLMRDVFGLIEELGVRHGLAGSGFS